VELPCKDVNETLVAHGENAEALFLKLLSERREIAGNSDSAGQAALFSFSTEKETEQPETPAPGAAEPLAAASETLQLNTTNPENIFLATSTAVYSVKGGIGKSMDSLKIMLEISHPVTGRKYRGRVDLFEDKLAEKYAQEACDKLGLDKARLIAELEMLSDLLEQHRERENRRRESSREEKQSPAPLTAQERKAIQEFGRQAKVISRLNDLLGKTGIVGEEKNRIFLLLIAASYKMRETLHALIQGSSGSGKTRLLKQIAGCMPPEVVEMLTRLSDKVLYNYPEFYFVNRLLCLEDMDGLSEDAEYALRQLFSEGVLTSSFSVKLDSGLMDQAKKVVRGPVASMACTTHGEIYEDNMSRVFLIAVDESAEQTKAIIDYQNRRAAGLIDQRQEQEIKKFIQDYIRELKPFEVVNPFANRIRLPQEAHKIRRLNDLFLNFVKMVTVFNQYQRKVDGQGRLVAELEDVETAIEIMFESIVLKVDELDGSLRQFYEQLKAYLKKTYGEQKVDFSLLEIRQALQVSKTQLFRYVNDLVRLEYLIQSGGHVNRGFRYRIVHWDNYQGLRSRIRENLEKQLREIKAGTPRNTSGTPE
jgi:energy-coupling factor transporter ATP-binding protein EcfA2